ncbi:MAG: helicase, partial [Kiritimatiellae bacterium]|nr:helicase [Kiritimatiellia bacterium]
GRTKQYNAFPGIVLGDTFRMQHVTQKDTLDDGAFSANSERILAQNQAPISVIIGNPPYSVSKGESYPALDKRIEETYVAGTTATNKNSLYDSYIKAFRWSSDRLSTERGGILCFVTNGGWLDANAAAGFRKCLQTEFDEIYCYNLRGNIRSFNRAEGENIFDVMVGITIILLVRLPASQHHGNATIHYRDIGDYKDRKEKLHTLDVEHSFFNPTWEGTLLTPNAHGDWINQRNDTFSSYIPIEPEKKFDTQTKSFFVTFSRGIATARDAWCYSFSKEELTSNMKCLINLYIDSIAQNQQIQDKMIVWNETLKISFSKGLRSQFDISSIRTTLYRPFCKQKAYFSSFWNERTYQFPKLFPMGKQGENVVICVSGNSLLISDCTPDLHFVGDAQCFPLYWYEEKDEDLFGNKTLVRHDAVSDFTLKEARSRYHDHTIRKEDIFYYVYGFLHSPDYRTTFAADLKKSLPRLFLVEAASDFRKIADLGHALAELHLNYETLDPYPLKEVGDFSNTQITKMTFPKKDKTRVLVNDTLLLEGIPLEAHDYVVNGRSPVEWVLDRYQIKTDKVSGITNNPNLWAPDNPRYITDLIKRLVTLSLESQRLIATLPKLSF